MKSMTALLLLVIFTGHANAQPAWVADALADGQRTKQALHAVINTLRSPYTVIVRGPYGRVQAFGAEAAKRYQTVTAVPNELTARELDVFVSVQTPRTWTYIPPPVKHVVLRCADGTILQPIAFTSTPQEWTNPLGARISSAGADVRFPYPAQDGNLYVVVIMQTGEERVHQLKAHERDRIR